MILLQIKIPNMIWSVSDYGILKHKTEKDR